MSKANYFYCLAKSEGCSKGMFGIIACSECEKNGDCRVCGRQETTLCEKCIHMTSASDKAIVTSEQ